MIESVWHNNPENQDKSRGHAAAGAETADEPATRTTEAAPRLPDLLQACPDCPSDDDRAAAGKQSNAWHERETASWEQWRDDRERDGAYPSYESWTQTDEYNALGVPPQVLPGPGCPECNFTGKRATAAGRQVLELLKTAGDQR